MMTEWRQSVYIEAAGISGADTIGISEHWVLTSLVCSRTNTNREKTPGGDFNRCNLDLTAI